MLHQCGQSTTLQGSATKKILRTKPRRRNTYMSLLLVSLFEVASGDLAVDTALGSCMRNTSRRGTKKIRNTEKYSTFFKHAIQDNQTKCGF